MESYMREREVVDERSLCEYWINTPPNSYLPHQYAGRLLGVVTTVLGLVLIVAGIAQWFET